MTHVNVLAIRGSRLAGAIRTGPRLLSHGGILPGVAAVAAAGLLAACGTAGGGPASASGGASQASPVVSARQLTGVGQVLVDKAGKTIYSPENGKMCAGSCLSFSFPVAATSAAALHAPGGPPGTLSTIHRPDGTTQVTYGGKPLYTFRLDQAPGQANGNNFTDAFGGTSFTWRAVTTSGQAAPAPSPSSTPSGGGIGY
jgi:predicted lipoprotein with Yx(FWY)xxD motif